MLKTDTSDMLDVIRDMTYGLMDNFRRVILTCNLNSDFNRVATPRTSTFVRA